MSTIKMNDLIVKGKPKMTAAIINYNFGPKNKWRREVWRELIDRSPNTLRNKFVLYLAGPENLSERILAFKGIRPCNIFAVEYNKFVVRKLRKRGVNVIHGELDKVIEYWRSNLPIDILEADLCSGITDRVADFAGLLIQCPAFRTGSSIMFNFLRGRDAYGSEYCNNITRIHNEIIEKKRSFGSDRQGGICEYVGSKHRGWLFFNLIINAVWLFSEMANPSIQNVDLGITINMTMKQMRPKFLSYKNTAGNFMDSIIFNYPLVFANIRRLLWKNKILNKVDHIDRSLESKISAAKAIRTIRLGV